MNEDPKRSAEKPEPATIDGSGTLNGGLSGSIHAVASLWPLPDSDDTQSPDNLNDDLIWRRIWMWLLMKMMGILEDATAASLLPQVNSEQKDY